MIKLAESEQKLYDFFTSQKLVTFSHDEAILFPDNDADGVYFIEKGFVKVYWMTESGYEKLHVIYKPGEVFPLMWALNDAPVGGYYDAIGQVACRKATKDTFIDFIMLHPEALFAITSKLANNFNVYVNMVDNLVISKAYPRLISRLLFLANRFGKKDGDSVILEVPLTHKSIADSIALTRETVSRSMNLLEDKQLIGKKGQHIIIYDVGKLEVELAENYESKPLSS